MWKVHFFYRRYNDVISQGIERRGPEKQREKMGFVPSLETENLSENFKYVNNLEPKGGEY